MDKRRSSRMDGLEESLATLSGRLSFPETPDIGHAVASRITAQPPIRDQFAPWARLRPWQRLAAACAVVLLAVAAALLAFPAARSTIARHLGLPNFEIILVDDTPTPVPTLTGNQLLLGEPVSLAEARAQVTYPIQMPEALGDPDEIYIRVLSSGQMVTLLYLPTTSLPPAAGSGVGALVMQFPATNHPGDLAKRVSMGVGRVREVDLGEREAFWITGESQLVLDQDPSETFEDLIGRESGNVLLWEADGLTFRLETSLDLADALVIARSMREQSVGTPAP